MDAKSAVLIILAMLNTGLSGKIDSSDLHERLVLSGKIRMLIPSTFTLMNRETLALKYPTAGHRPTEVYTNVNSTINIALNHTANKATPDDLPAVKKVMETQFNRAPFEFIRSELKDLNGAPCVILEFVSPAADTSIYNFMAILSLEGRLVMVTFNCTANQRKEWELTGQKIINSIKISK